MSKDFTINGVRCYIKEEWKNEYGLRICDFIDKVNEIFSKYEKYNGMDIIDCSYDEGVQVRIFHKDIKNYCFLSFTFLSFDFSNEEALLKRMRENKSFEDTKFFDDYKKFLDDGRKYGWD